MIEKKKCRYCGKEAKVSILDLGTYLEIPICFECRDKIKNICLVEMPL